MGKISHNLWDEIGEGSNEFTHVNLYKDLLSRRGIKLPEDHYSHLYDWQGLTGYNAFMLGGVTRQHYYKFIGVMAMTELLDPSQYEKLVTGCRRIGLTDRDVHYYSEHITVDIGHADGWLNNVIVPIARKFPKSMEEVFFGAVLRLQTCNDYYDLYLKDEEHIRLSLSSAGREPGLITFCFRMLIYIFYLCESEKFQLLTHSRCSGKSIVSIQTRYFRIALSSRLQYDHSKIFSP